MIVEDIAESEIHRFILHQNENQLAESLWQLLSCIVGDTLSEIQEPEKKFQLFQTAAVKFMNLRTNFILINDWNEILFKYLPENKLPTYFDDLIRQKQESPLDIAFYPTKPDNVRRIAQFGSKVWATYTDVKSVINNRYVKSIDIQLIIFR
jgi:hypothetical protein